MTWVGKVFRRAIGPLTLTDFVRYQGASGDLNPIHHDIAVARRAGFEDVISVGMLQAGALVNTVADELGVEHLRHLVFRFKQPIFPGDTLVCKAEIARQYIDNGESRLDVTLEGQTDRAGTVVEGRATFATPGDIEPASGEAA